MIQRVPEGYCPVKAHRDLAVSAAVEEKSGGFLKALSIAPEGGQERVWLYAGLSVLVRASASPVRYKIRCIIEPVMQIATK
jgi:hypothetical protein